MIEIDIVKASGNTPSNLIKPSYYTDDYSETDTALNTPTGSMTDSIYARRFSSSSSSVHHHYYHQQRKPSIIPKSPELVFTNASLEQQKIHALETQLEEHIKRETVLKSQLLTLAAQNQGQSTLNRINQHINQFLTNQHQRQEQDESIWNDKQQQWTGNEIPALFGDDDGVHDPHVGETSTSNTTNSSSIIFIFRLKAMLDHFTTSTSTTTTTTTTTTTIEFCTELHRALDAWQEVYYTTNKIEHEKKVKNQERMTRLLEALHKSVLKNKMMEKDHALLTKQYELDIKTLVKERQSYQKQMEQKRRSIPPIKQLTTTTIVNSELLHVHCRKSLESTKTLLESQIKQLDNALSTCQEERDEYETTLEMVRQEMETMLEELEDTRQQRLRYKTQASRLRAGLEAIQKKRQTSSKKHDNQDEDDDDSSDEDEAKEAIRILYNEAERQAVDLDRECKRQALTLDSIRRELKLTEKKHQSVETEKTKQLTLLEQSSRDLTRRIESLEVEKTNLILIHREQQRQQHHLLTASQSEASMTSSHSSLEESEDEISHAAKIHALQIALKAAKSDAVLYRTKISQLERQSSLVDLTFYVNRLQEMFQKELAIVTSFEHPQQKHQHKEIADSIELEQRQWKQDKLKAFQKQFDIDLLHVDRELRCLSFKLTDLEDETDLIKSRHVQELSLVKHQYRVENKKKLQRVMSSQRMREQELRNQLETLYQKNQTLQEESMILYGRNMLMAHQLGRIDS
jgi:hypothetical protein